MNAPDCPYCRNSGTFAMLDYACTACGAEYDRGTAMRIERLSPTMWAWRAGDYQGARGDAYLFMMPELSREELRHYAQGYLSAATARRDEATLWLYGPQARVDAFSVRAFGRKS